MAPSQDNPNLVYQTLKWCQVSISSIWL